MTSARYLLACALCSALIIVVGCGDDAQAPANTNTESGGAASSASTPNNGAATSIPAPAEPAKIAWKFSPNRNYVYEYGQNTSAKMTSGESSMDSQVKGTGKFRVVGGENSGTLEIDFAMTEGTAGGRPIPQSSAPPVSAVLPITANGAISQEGADAGANMRALVPLFFPIPPEPLIADSKLSKPMTAMPPGFPMLSGIAQFEADGFQSVGGRNCVKFRVACELKSNADSAQPATMVGSVVCLFAYEDGCFVSIKGTVRATMDGAGASMQQTHEMSLRLKDIEAGATP